MYAKQDATLRHVFEACGHPRRSRSGGCEASAVCTRTGVVMNARMLLCVATLATAAFAGGGVWLDQTSIAAETRAYRASRTSDGRPNLNGIWQAINTATWDLVD